MHVFHAAFMQALQQAELSVELAAPGILILEAPGAAPCLVSASPLSHSLEDGMEVFDRALGSEAHDGLVMTLGETILLLQGVGWRKRPLLLEPEDSEALVDLIMRSNGGVPPGSASITDEDVIVVTAPTEIESPLALWLSRREGDAVRPVGFLGNEEKLTTTSILLRDESGTPLTGDLVLSAHDIRSGGSVAWALPLHVTAPAPPS